MYMWMGFLLLSDCRNSSCAITRLATLSSICKEGSGEGGCAQLEGKEQANPGNCEVAGDEVSEQGWVSEPKGDGWGGLSTRKGRW